MFEKKYNIFLLVISLFLLIGLLIYSNFFEVLSLLATANLIFIPLAYSLWFIGLLLRSLRWNFLLKEVGIKVRFLELVKIYTLGMFISNITPLKTGDPIRSIFLKVTDGKSISSSLPSIFLERVFDIIILTLFSVLGIIILTLGKITVWVILAIAVYLAAICIGIYILISRERLKKFFQKITKLLSFLKFIKNLEKRVESFSTGLSKTFRKYNNLRALSICLSYSLFIWILDGLILFISFLMLGSYINPFILLSAWAISILVGLISFLPGGLGSSEAIIIFLLTTFLFISPAKILAASILTRFFSYWNYVLIGVVLLNFTKYRYKI